MCTIFHHTSCQGIFELFDRHEIKWNVNQLFFCPLLSPGAIKFQFYIGGAIDERDLKGEEAGGIRLFVVDKDVVDIQFHHPARRSVIAQRIGSEGSSEGCRCIGQGDPNHRIVNR